MYKLSNIQLNIHNTQFYYSLMYVCILHWTVQYAGYGHMMLIIWIIYFFQDSEQKCSNSFECADEVRHIHLYNISLHNYESRSYLKT